MKLLAELTEKDVFGEIKNTNIGEVSFRKAVRSVLLKDGKIGVNFAKKRNIYKLPGGGMNEAEGKEGALKREVMEETGCTIGNIRELGAIIEYRHYEDHSLIQISYCYLSECIEEAQPHLEPDEVEQGFEFGWFDIDELIALMEEVNPDSDDGGAFFIAKRELIFLKEAKFVLYS
jgi:8-oxo-dGTP diphosphatase